MRNVAQEVYEHCKIGATGWIRPDFTRGETLNGFQSTLIAAKVLQEHGKIIIQEIHCENQTGHKFVDAIKFVRLR